MFEYNPDKHYPKETESRVVIRFQDCDPLQHLNNAKYFDYFFNAREDQVPKLYGLEMIDMIHKYKAAWVVYNHNISYVRPAKVGEWVRIMSRLLWYNHNTVGLEYYMTDDSKKELKTVLWTTMRYVTVKEGKSTEHQGAVLDFLKATSENLDISELSIGERVKFLKQKLAEG
ncbi:acyl-CoA thioesterase [Cecembia lonarensis]|uniref:Acyl-CoA thioester hydrolase, YbgC/YbaW family n=1 Tax=Cecembia lonarensis (strain CCUG 58316 / KCTC 22772 / LW9) TaxID=1225176 RepID=K1L9I1_CECL9|nr:acyl-CoA thioesterase [Cecembia lonarensis]EKB48852.1 acyl-CoA thioester hydrolase, YbgC/YbaW family [Cecembia lonarensis LW9]